MASRAQIIRLEQRIEDLVTRFAPPEPPFEFWLVKDDEARLWANPQYVITRAELEARPAARIEIGFVRPTGVPRLPVRA